MRVLYVEDNRINALLFQEALKLQPGLELQIAEDGQQALTMAADWHPEVLVLDSHLPDLSGTELLQKLRSIAGLEAVPAFMCSADVQEDDLQAAQSAGFRGYWPKPIDLALVLGDLQALQDGRA